MTVGLQIEYRRKPKSHLRDEDVERVGQELQDLAERNKQQIAPEMVVDAASDPQSAMHRYFTWDDGEAARLYRLDEARLLIRSIEVKVVVRDGPSPETAYTRRFHHVRVSEPEDEPLARYVPLEVVTSRASYMAQVLANAERELLGWRERVRTYQSLKEFARFKSVIQAIDQLRDDRSSAAAD